MRSQPGQPLAVMKLSRFRPPLAALVLAAAGTAFAQAPAEGEVRKLDLPQQKVTLKHNGVQALGMPPMTMVFRVKTPSMLDGLAVGDHVKFTVEKVEGTYTVTQMQKLN